MIPACVNPPLSSSKMIQTDQLTSKDLKNRVKVLSPELPICKRVGRCALAAVWTLAVVIANIVTLGIPLAISLRSKAINHVTENKIVSDQIKQLKTSLDISLDQKYENGGENTAKSLTVTSLINELRTDFNIEYKKAEPFANKIMGLKADVQRLNDALPHTHKKLLETLENLGGDKEFVDVFKVAGSSKGARFVKIVAVKSRSALVSDSLKSRVQIEQKESYEFKDVAEGLKNQRKSFKGFKRGFFWYITHPFSAFHAWDSNLFPQKYNSQEDNPTYCVHQMTHQNRPIFFNAGPSDFNSKASVFLEDSNQFRLINLDIQKPIERFWISQMHDKAGENPKNHTMVLGYTTKERRGFASPGPISQVLENYKSALLKNDNFRFIDKTTTGSVIPANVLSFSEIELCFETAKDLLVNKQANTKEEAMAALLICDSLMETKAILKRAEEIDLQSESDPDMVGLHVSKGCKQDFDRGPAMTATTVLFLKASDPSKNSLTQNDVKEAVMLADRARHEDRVQLTKKAKVMETIFTLLPDWNSVQEAVNKVT